MRQLWTRAFHPRGALLVVAASLVVTFAASSPSYSAAIATVGAAKVPVGGVSSGSAAAGRCSIAAASKAATAAHFLVDPSLGRTPINSVICGAFVGPGSHAMAATVAAPTGCGFSIGWGVFRFRRGVWALVMKQYNGVLKLRAVGSDIRATQGYPRHGDQPCSPSRKRSRIWHWNGHKFVAGPWKVISTRPKIVHLYYIRSPSHNIWCDVGDEGMVVCESKNLPQSVTLTPDGALKICNNAPSCVFNDMAFGSGTPVLRYGQQDVQGFYRCKSEKIGITCTVTTGTGKGKGFLINSASVTPVGP
jgi:hypothetical protein